MPALYIGIDVGTTVLKAAAFDAGSGRVLASALRRLRVSAGADGTREQSAEALRGSLGAVIRELRSALKSCSKKVAGIGLASQGGSTVICDRRTGAALTPLILWNDVRHRPYMAQLLAARPKTYWRRLALRTTPGAGLARLLWFKDRAPGLIHHNNVYSGAGEFLFHALTGVWRQDAGNAVQTGCYDVPRERLARSPLDIIGVDASLIPPMREGHTTAPLSRDGGVLCGLPSGIPCAGPYMDHEAGYMSAAAVSRRPLQCSLGTAWVGNIVMPPEIKWRSPIQIVIPSPAGKGRLVVQPLLAGNAGWDWGLKELLPAGRGKAFEKCATVFDKAVLPHAGLVCMPWFTHGNHVSGGHGFGVFLGLNAHTPREDMLRALACGMCFEFHRVFQHLFAGRIFDSVVLSGGLGKLSWFQKIFSALFHPVPVLITVDGDVSGARGALYAFDRRIASTRTRGSPPPSEAAVTEICRRSQEYKAAFDLLLGAVETGAPITLGRNAK
ncbi:MAG TPA: hypothetical protein ENN09_05015 [Planctomycetes bacterium]|nr:hypothetical protein [Planctomycetota bacterium]